VPKIVLVYSHPDDSDIQGIWGPYDSEDAAKSALEELKTWPLDGGKWETVVLHEFRTTPERPTTVYRGEL
jgi:hypothetical protein